MSQSHIIPLTDFGKQLAGRGIIVSIITTPLNAIRYEATVDHAVKAGMRIQMIPLEFPGLEAGLPPGCENMDSLTSMDLAKEFFAACEMLKAPLEKLIRELRPKPSSVISTNALPWTQDLAETFKIPRYVFETVSCFALLCSRKLSRSRTEERAISESGKFSVPDIPHNIELTKVQMPETMMIKSSDRPGGRVLDQIIKSQNSARGALVNSFEELEPWYVEGYRKERQNVWCIGPVSLCNKELVEKSYRGSKSSFNQKCCLTWLDSMKPKSVVYACFGSLSRISLEQIKEIGLGLEASSFPFVWIIRGLDCSVEVEKWLEEGKFEQRVRGRGLVIRGWAPQVLVLSHPSVGGFLTHCGWNSTPEGICAGMPMITWPMFAEQFFNEKFIVNVLGIGVRIGAEFGATPGATEEQRKALVNRDQVRECVKELMDEEKGKEMRTRAQKLGEMAKEALEEGGSSYLNIGLLIQDVMQQSCTD